ncbi:23 kDa integral membrane protein-like isoform X2 [Thalassophryne amazonica]|uniref:23 kDa integral membrane protein-like isoform X2 n=1 Tax=Thalassophryne amazonica TaxID=390379 RepID=UPI001470C55F|nr:23 kDa integral membrane protein-like isoform X2 [Thalassophryne amazonica]
MFFILLSLNISLTEFCSLFWFGPDRVQSANMGLCRRYMRGITISLTLLLLVFGVLMIGVGFSSGYSEIFIAEWWYSHCSLVLQVFGPITMVLSVLGICAVTLDIKPLLLLFSALLFVEFSALMVVASPLVQLQAQTDIILDDRFKNVTPLYTADEQLQVELKKLQVSDSCCGLMGFEDWKDEIPVSCYCTPVPPLPTDTLLQSADRGQGSSVGLCVWAGRDLYTHTSNATTNVWVHSKPCGPILKQHLSFIPKVSIGVISAFATVMLAAIGLCLVLGLEDYWRTAPVETTVDEYNRVKFKPKHSLT